MKAFLSHSSLDKAFVDQVAKHLGREFIVFDSYSFDHGEAFKDEICRGLGKSNIFVFFVSRSALKSFWVDFEIDQAQKHLFNNEIAKAIGIRLDKSIEFDQLPHWLRRSNVPYMESPAAAARLIKDHINKLKRDSTPDLLIGRSQDIARVEQALAPLSDHRPPGMVALWGLPGIGRRAVARRVLKDILDLQRPLPVAIEAGDNAADLRLKLAALLDTPANSDDYLALQREAEQAAPGQNVAECLRYFEMAEAARELVLLVDQGGLLDDQGELIPDFNDLLRAVYATERLRTIIISRRRLMPFDLEPGLALPSVRIDRLSEEATRILLQQLRTRAGLVLSPRDIETLAERIKGYPPAAYHAIGLIKDYGRELILRDGREIIDFRATSFLRLLEKDNKFSNTERAILGILPQFDTLPLPVLGAALQADQETIDREATRLLDMALLNIDEDGFYSISDPVREVTYRVFGTLVMPYEKLAQAIDRYLQERREDSEENAEPLSLLRARFKAYALAGRDRSRLFYVASDLARLQQTLYHEQEYDRSIQFGREALTIRPNQPEVLKYLARAQTQLEHYREAAEIVESIKAFSMKDAKFLEGFIFRKQGQTGKAIAAYREALALGTRGVAIHRELGQCLFEEEQFGEAREHLARARESDPDNKFVLDYDIQVAIAEERFSDARKSLEQLEQVEDEMRFQHRLSTLEFAEGRFPAAFEAAERAINSTRRAHFEVIAQYIKSAIRSKNLSAAQGGLGMLSTRFAGIRADIQNGLWARYYLAQGRLDDAMIFWRKIKQKGTPIHRRIHEDILVEMLRGSTYSGAERTKLQADLDALRRSPTKRSLDALELDLA